MGMERWMSVFNPSSGLIRDRDGVATMVETNEIQKYSTVRMTDTDTCGSPESRDGAIRCPIPCKSNRSYKDFKTAQDLSDFIVSKASPPYFMGSPPVRASNPLIHDRQFCAWKAQNVDQSPGIPIPTKGYSARYRAKEGSKF